MNHIYDKFVIALDHSTQKKYKNKYLIYFKARKKTTNKMKALRRRQQKLLNLLQEIM